MTITPRDTENGRFYPIGDKLYVSVTNVLDPLASSGLVPWSGWLAAKTAVQMLPLLVASFLKGECGRTYHGHGHEFSERCTSACPCGKCAPCLQRKIATTYQTESSRRAKEGSIVHAWIEDWINSDGALRRDIAPELRPYITAFDAFVRDYGLTADSFVVCEAVAFNETEEYAGTTDGAVLIHASGSYLASVLVASIANQGMPEDEWITARQAAEGHMSVCLLLDWKTREKEGPKLYPTHSLQLTAYRRAQKLMIKGTSTWVEMPATDGALLVQLRPDGYTARPVVTDDAAFAAFLAQKSVFWWLKDHGSRSVGTYTFKAKAMRNRVRPKTEPILSDKDGAALALAFASAEAAAGPSGPDYSAGAAGAAINAILPPAAPAAPRPRRAPAKAGTATPGGAVVTGFRGGPTRESLQPAGARPAGIPDDEIPF